MSSKLCIVGIAVNKVWDIYAIYNSLLSCKIVERFDIIAIFKETERE